jgi:guanosine-3',5'-bis(diphosphate) 3'-pyrophosphohydrolase
MKEKDELVKTTTSFLKRMETSEVLDAYEFVRAKHAGQFRIGGEDYICHVVRVALAVAKH